MKKSKFTEEQIAFAIPQAHGDSGRGQFCSGETGATLVPRLTRVAENWGIVWWAPRYWRNQMRLLLTAIALTALGPPAFASDITFGAGEIPFTDGHWTLSGDAVIAPESISIAAAGTHAEGWASMQATYQAQHIDMEFVISDWSTDNLLSIELFDHGADFFDRWFIANAITSKTATFAVQLGTPLGPVPDLLTAFPGDRMRLFAYCAMTQNAETIVFVELHNLTRGGNLSVDYLGPDAGRGPGEFAGPIMLHFDATGGSAGLTVDHLLLGGSYFVPNEPTTWSAVKAAFR